MALWFSLCSGLFFFSSQQVALEVLWRPGPSLEPGKGINYTPFSYSFSSPAFSSPLFSLFAFLARSFFLPPPSLFSFPFLLLLSPFSLYVSLCASYLPPLTRFLLFCLFLSPLRQPLAPRKLYPLVSLLVPGHLRAVHLFLTFLGWEGKERRKNRAFEPGLSPEALPRGVSFAPSNLSEGERAKEQKPLHAPLPPAPLSW